MSHQPEQIQPNPADIQFGPETGALNFDGLAEAYHGIRAFVSQKRMELAGNRMERMDHKNALYTDSVESLQSSNFVPAETANGQPARPRNIVERFMDRRIERKDWKAGMKRAQRKMEEKQFGSRYTSTLGVKSRLEDAGRRHDVGKLYRDGYISADERRRTRSHMNATPARHMNRRMRNLLDDEASSHQRAVNAADQPVLYRWRNWRRERAIGSIKKHHHNTQEHRQRQADARS